MSVLLYFWLWSLLRRLSVIKALLLASLFLFAMGLRRSIGGVFFFFLFPAESWWFGENKANLTVLVKTLKKQSHSLNCERGGPKLDLSRLEWKRSSTLLQVRKMFGSRYTEAKPPTVTPQGRASSCSLFRLRIQECMVDKDRRQHLDLAMRLFTPFPRLTLRSSLFPACLVRRSGYDILAAPYLDEIAEKDAGRRTLRGVGYVD